MEETKHPPIHDPVYKVLRLERRPYAVNVTIVQPDGSSDLVHHLEARKRLLIEGVKDPDKVLDTLWNTYKLTIKLTKQC